MILGAILTRSSQTNGDMPIKDVALDAAIALRITLHLHASLQQKSEQERSSAIRTFESACPVHGCDGLPSLRQLTLMLDLIQHNTSEEHVSVTLIILEKALRACDELLLSASNWQLLVTTAFLLASKQLDDDSLNISAIRRLCILYEHRERGEMPNSRSSAACSVPSQHADAEIAFCSVCGWATFVSPAHLHKYQHGLSLTAAIIDELHSPVLSADDYAYLKARRPSIAGHRRPTCIAIRASPQLLCGEEEESANDGHSAKVARYSAEGSQMVVLAGKMREIDKPSCKVNGTEDERMKLVADDFVERAIDLEGGSGSSPIVTKESSTSEDSFPASIVSMPHVAPTQQRPPATSEHFAPRFPAEPPCTPAARHGVGVCQQHSESAGFSGAVSSQITTNALTSAAGYALALRIAHICREAPGPSPGCVLVRRPRPIGRSPLGQHASSPACLSQLSAATCVGAGTNQLVPEALQPWVRRNKRGRGSMEAVTPQHRANYMR